ncbi:MAG: hypothetical protein Q7R40_04705 [Phaeospirillum sp.]|nr:hypothetical protein [Phaeospirillum sp.]
MTSPGEDYDAVGPREARAIHILLSAKAVAREVEDLRRRLNNPLIPPAEAERYSAEMNGALSRLCNLITVAIAKISEDANEKFRLHFDLLLDEVRGRVLRMNFHQMLEQLVLLRDQAHEALLNPVYRLGFSFRLERAYTDVLNNLTAMGASEELGLDPKLLAEIIADIRALAEIEIRVFKLIDFDAKPPSR